MSFTPPFFPQSGGQSLAESRDTILIDHVEIDHALATWLSRRLTLAGWLATGRGVEVRRHWPERNQTTPFASSSSFVAVSTCPCSPSRVCPTVIGAAVGALSAIEKIVSSWPKALPVSILIALASKDQPAQNVLQITESCGSVSVTFAIDGEPIEPGHIYVSPLGQHLAIGRFGVIRTEEPSFFDSVQPSVNRLFSAAAVVYGPRVIGVVLSGAQYDGVQGMRDIEAAGGVTIVQGPDDAVASQMPRHVLQNDSPRYSVNAFEIEPLIRRLVVGET